MTSRGGRIPFQKTYFRVLPVFFAAIKHYAKVIIRQYCVAETFVKSQLLESKTDADNLKKWHDSINTSCLNS